MKVESKKEKNEKTTKNNLPINFQIIDDVFNQYYKKP